MDIEPNSTHNMGLVFLLKVSELFSVSVLAYIFCDWNIRAMLNGKSRLPPPPHTHTHLATTYLFSVVVFRKVLTTRLVSQNDLAL